MYHIYSNQYFIIDFLKINLEDILTKKTNTNSLNKSTYSGQVTGRFCLYLVLDIYELLFSISLHYN
jgi:hypothetical protein